MAASAFDVTTGWNTTSGRFSVGQDVPILGAISYPVNGNAPAPSVEYRSFGVIFDLAPVVRDSVVDLAVGQQLSNKDCAGI